jgi:D-tyrosyl-tRNA(Tyr) deacylase
MTKAEKYYQEIKKKFDTDNDAEIAATLKEIRVNGQALIIPLMLEVLEKTNYDNIREEILSILGQLKDKNSVQYIVEALAAGTVKKYRKEFITTCWQSGLDYSEHITLFAKEFVIGDYVTSIEAFTVIEEWIIESSPDKIVECKKFLIDAVSKIDNEKKPLYVELVKLVESYL